MASRKTSSCTTYHELQTTESRGLFSCLLCLQPSFSSRPQHLDCHHAFCERCLQAHHRLYTVNLNGYKPSSQGNLVHCPTCRQVTQLASNRNALPSGQQSATTGNGNLGDAHLRKISLATDAASQRCDACLTRRRVEVADFYCNKCSLNLCNACKSAHDQQSLFTDHSVIHISNKDTVSLGCDIHGGRYVCTYYCYDCDIPACAVCLLHDHGPAVLNRSSVAVATGRVFTSHRTAKLRDALAGRRDAIKTLLNALGPRLDRFEARMKRLNYHGRYSNPGSGLIVSTGHRCHQYSLNGSSGKSLTQTHSANVSGCSSPLLSRKHRQITELKQNDDDDEDDDEDDVDEDDDSKESEMHVVRFFIINNVSRSDSHSSEDNIMNNDSGDVSDVEYDDVWNHHSTVELISDQLSHVRRLYDVSTRLLELSQSRRLLAVHREVTSRLQTVLDVELPLLHTAINDILDAESMAASARSFSPTNPGSNSSIASTSHLIRTRHSSGLSATSGSGNSDPVSSNDDGPSECPLSMLIRPKLVWKFEKQRSNDVMGELWNPCAVAFLQHDQRLVTAEYDMTTARNNKIRIFDATGKTLTVLMQGQIQPLGVAVTRDGNIALTDCIGKRVKILSPTTGQLIADIGKGQFGWPYGIAVNSHGQLIITDAFNDSVSIYNPSDGKRLRQFGSSGTRDTNFRNPYHVTVDDQDNILVSDSGNDCVKAFDSTGSRYLFRCDVTTAGAPSLTSLISAEQKSKMRLHRHRAGGRLKGPRGVCVDLRGNILVADDCCRLCMFDSTGRYVRNLLTDEDLVKFPEAVHCSRSGSGLMALTEWNPNNMFAVKVFTLYE